MGATGSEEMDNGDEVHISTASKSSFGYKSSWEEELEESDKVIGSNSAFGDKLSAEGEIEDGDEVINSTIVVQGKSSEDEIEVVRALLRDFLVAGGVTIRSGHNH